MNDSIHQVPQLDPTFSESSSDDDACSHVGTVDAVVEEGRDILTDRSNATPSSNNKRKARLKSKKEKAAQLRREEAAQLRRRRIITILLFSIPFVLSLAALLIVLTRDKDDTQTTTSAASAIVDETDHQIRPVSNNTQSEMSMQPNDSQSTNDKADDYLTYDEVSDPTFTTSNMSQEKCHEIEIVSMFTTWNLLRKGSSGFESVESSFEIANNSDAVDDDETFCLEEGEYMLMAMVSEDGHYSITSNGMLIEEGQDERTSFSIPFVPRVNLQSVKAPFIGASSPLLVAPSPSDDSLILATQSPSEDSLVELFGESINTAAVENDDPTYSPTSWFPTYSPTSNMPTYSPSTTTTHEPISDMPSYSPTSKYVFSAAKTHDPISDMPTYSPSDSEHQHTYEPTFQSTDTLHSPTYYPSENTLDDVLV